MTINLTKANDLRPMRADHPDHPDAPQVELNCTPGPWLGFPLALMNPATTTWGMHGVGPIMGPDDEPSLDDFR